MRLTMSVFAQGPLPLRKEELEGYCLGPASRPPGQLQGQSLRQSKSTGVLKLPWVAVKAIFLC